MRFPGDAPWWKIKEAEKMQAANTQRILMRLSGTLRPSKEYIVEKMRKEYSCYGKNERSCR